MNPIDLTLLHWLNGLAGRNAALDALVAFVTTYAPLLFLLLFAVYFFASPRDRELRRRVVLAGVAGALAVAASVGIGALVFRPRPVAALPPGQVHLLVPHTGDSSFPSDHAMGSGAFAGGMWRAGGSARWAFLALAVLVAFSRAIAGVHWPSDLLASLLLGGIIAGLTLTVLRRPLLPVADLIIHAVEAVENRIRPQG
ncbi:MAG: phosphatase PAP2 family protein [Symbiobacteriia bacterium]